MVASYAAYIVADPGVNIAVYTSLHEDNNLFKAFPCTQDTISLINSINGDFYYSLH